MTKTHTAATANQLSFIDRLVAERTVTCAIPDRAAFVDALRVERITRDGASLLINTLLKTPVDPKPVPEKNPDAAPDYAAASGPVRKGEPFNRYAGKCVLCRQLVNANEGTYRKGSRGWETLHLPGGCPEVEGSEVVADAGASSWATVTADLQRRSPGYFAVPSITGTNDITFFAIKVNRGYYDPKKKGQHYFAHVVGGKNEDALKVSPEFIAKALAALDAVGEDAAGRAYANHFVCCYRCGRQLTDKPSRDRGLGPECATKSF